jgi:CTD small phosphatase-like protein 2
LSRSEFYQDKKTLVFDLDETLIHCNESPTMPSDIKLMIKMQTGEIFEAGINIRPYALTLLHNLAAKFELILFTASHSSYANVVVDYLDPDKKLFQHRLYREHCYYTETGVYVKDLRIINRQPS